MKTGWNSNWANSTNIVVEWWSKRTSL